MYVTGPKGHMAEAVGKAHHHIQNQKTVLLGPGKLS